MEQSTEKGGKELGGKYPYWKRGLGAQIDRPCDGECRKNSDNVRENRRVVVGQGSFDVGARQQKGA